MTPLTAVEPLDPHAIVETCPSCTRQRIIGRVEPQYGYAIGRCDECRRHARIGRLFHKMFRAAAAFAGLRPVAGYNDWVLTRNMRFIEPMAPEHKENAE